MSVPIRQALFDGELNGTKPLRYIYLDEAGTSANEPVSVVLGIIVDADKHWIAAQDRIAELIEQFVPAHLKPGFIFHAKAIWGDKKLRENWPEADRLHLLHAMMAIPRELGMAISIGMVRRNVPDVEIQSMSQAELHHLIAFALCAAEADSWLRNNGRHGEIATLICEDVPRVRQFLRYGLLFVRNIPWNIKESRPASPEEVKSIEYNKTNHIIKANRIVDTVHFLEKRDAPILQIADACAFAFRRFFAEQQGGENFIASVLAGQLDRNRWTGPAGSISFSWHRSMPLDWRLPNFQRFFQKQIQNLRHALKRQSRERSQ